MIIEYNSKLKRYEVYSSSRSVVRNNEIQPVFVSADYQKCRQYVREVKE